MTAVPPSETLPLRAVGRSPVRVTELSFGGAAIGNLYSEVSEEDARAAVDAAWDGGIRYFDTAPHYGLGLSERRLGHALRHRPRVAVGHRGEQVADRRPAERDLGDRHPRPPERAQRQSGPAARTLARCRGGHERGLIRRPDMPPSIARAVPVTDDASGLAR